MGSERIKTGYDIMTVQTNVENQNIKGNGYFGIQKVWNVFGDEQRLLYSLYQNQRNISQQIY
jgi:hypothetical protein